MAAAFPGRGGGHGSVPRVRPAEAGMSPAWQTGAPPMAAGAAPTAGPAAAPMASGGSFLGTAASAAAGVIGGSLLLGGIRSMMGGQHGAQAAFDPKAGATETSPGSGGSARGHPPREARLHHIPHPPAPPRHHGARPRHPP